MPSKNPRQKPCNKPHFVLFNGELIPYANRASAKRKAKDVGKFSMPAFVIEDCGDHWGLWEGYVDTGALTVSQLSAFTDQLARILDQLSEGCQEISPAA